MPYSKELKQSTSQELKEQMLTLRKDLFKLRNERELSKRLEQPHRLRSLRKDVARINTLLRERELSGDQG